MHACSAFMIFYGHSPQNWREIRYLFLEIFCLTGLTQNFMNTLNQGLQLQNPN